MRPIQAGDLVVATRATPCCGSLKFIGAVFRVELIDAGDSYCSNCGKDTSSEFIAWDLEDCGMLLKTLTRIDPLPESETQDNHESLTA